MIEDGKLVTAMAEKKYKLLIKEPGNLNDVEKKFISENSKYFQSVDWANIKFKLGKQPKFILLYEENEMKNSWLFFTLELKLIFFRCQEIRLETEPIFYENADRMLNFLIDYCKKNKYDNILFQTNMTNWTINLNDYPINFSNIENFGTHIIDLNHDLSDIYKNMHKKHRNMIKKATKMQYYVVEEKSDEALHRFFTLVNETYRRSKKFGCSKEYLKNILSSEYSRLFFCYSSKSILAASALIMGNKKQAYYLHGGSIVNSEGASNLLHWYIIKQLKEEGYKKYDFGGVSYDPHPKSKAYGIKIFKSRFGGGFVHTYRGEIIINKTKARLLFILRKIYNNSYYLQKMFYTRN